jgi:hypothetical protein
LLVMQVLDAKSKAEEAAATSAAALSAAERKAKLYRGDGTALLTDYDAWVQSLLAKKSSSGSGGTPAASAAARGHGPSSLVNSSNGGPAAGPELGSWAGGSQSPLRDGGLSRTASQLASPVGLSPARTGQDADVERYDRIAALLENRGVGASLSRVLSGKASPAPSASGALGSPVLASRGSLSGSKVLSGLLSPKPVFK